jgi:toxin YoeB
MKKLWADEAWTDYLEWQTKDKKTLRKINFLINDIDANGASTGIGKPEFLKHKKAWSRRIDGHNRLVYNISDRSELHIIACKGHYEE